ncbi:hypothetical protein O3G_MSEX000953 [Manduca sexta]|nr:hypothetical protein O3G_MSEX000953 [Manduca sexta]
MPKYIPAKSPSNATFVLPPSPIDSHSRDIEAYMTNMDKRHHYLQERSKTR